MQKRESVELRLDEWAKLESIAQSTESIAAPGKRGGERCPSWRVLLRRIAKGELVVSENPNLKEFETHS